METKKQRAPDKRSVGNPKVVVTRPPVIHGKADVEAEIRRLEGLLKTSPQSRVDAIQAGIDVWKKRLDGM